MIIPSGSSWVIHEKLIFFAPMDSQKDQLERLNVTFSSHGVFSICKVMSYEVLVHFVPVFNLLLLAATNFNITIVRQETSSAASLQWYIGNTLSFRLNLDIQFVHKYAHISVYM